MATNESLSITAVNFTASMSSGVSNANNDAGSCVISIDEFTEIRIKTFLAHESLKEKVQEFLNKLEPFIELSEDKLTAIDDNYIRTKKIVLAGSTVSAVGGGLIIAGTAAAPGTFGGSLALSAVGGAMVVTGTTASVYCQYKGSKERKLYLEECMGKAQEIEKVRDEVKELHEEYIQQCILLAEAVKALMTTNTTFKLDLNTLKHLLMGMQASNYKAVGATVIKAAAITPGVVNAGHILGSCANSICRIVKAVGPSLVAASNITLHLGIALGSIGVLVDIVVGTMALVNIINKTKCSESKALTRNIVKAKDILEKVQAYYNHLTKEPEELFTQADDALTYYQDQSTVKQLQQEKEHTQQENKHLQTVIRELEQSHKTAITAITELKQENESLKTEIREQQLHFEQEQEKQRREMQQMQQQMEQKMQQQMEQKMQQQMELLLQMRLVSQQ